MIKEEDDYYGMHIYFGNQTHIQNSNKRLVIRVNKELIKENETSK